VIDPVDRIAKKEIPITKRMVVRPRRNRNRNTRV
jgi:hypothetical protein